MNTRENNVEVTFKYEPYNTYQYDVNDDGKVTGDAELKMKYKERFDNDKNTENIESDIALRKNMI